jgi:predicted nucleic acid-binding protein
LPPPASSIPGAATSASANISTFRCKVPLTEDFQHEREIEGLRIINPFS